MISDDKRIVCSACNFIAIELIPMYDKPKGDDNPLFCRQCKKKIIAGKPVIKFKRNPEVYKKLEEEMNRKQKKREIITPK